MLINTCKRVSHSRLHPHSAPEEVHFTEPQPEIRQLDEKEEVFFFDVDSASDSDSHFGSLSLDPVS